MDLGSKLIKYREDMQISKSAIANALNVDVEIILKENETNLNIFAKEEKQNNNINFEKCK